MKGQMVLREAGRADLGEAAITESTTGTASVVAMAVRWDAPKVSNPTVDMDGPPAA